MMNRIINAVFFIFVSCFFSILSYGEECSEIDLTKSAPESLVLHFELPFDQSGRFCSSFVIADLLSYDLGKSVSPYDVAYAIHSSKYARARDNSNKKNIGMDQGGPGVENETDILKALQERGLGVCPMKEMPAAWDQQRQHWEPYEAMMKELLTIRKKIRTDKSFESYLKNIEDADCSLGVQSHIPLPVSEILSILEAYRKKDLIDALEAMAQKTCANKYFPLDKNLILQEESGRPITKVIDKVLEQVHKPMAWSFNTKHIDKVGGGPHEVSIIGRKKINGQCMYVIRNSYGHNCDYYREPYKAHCDIRRGTLLFTKKEIERWSLEMAGGDADDMSVYYLDHAQRDK